MKTKTKLKKWLAVTLAVVMAFSLTACGGGDTAGSSETSGSETKEVKQGGTFVYGLEQEMLSLDPAFSYSLTTSIPISTFCESWLTTDPKEPSTLVPLLAEKWDVSEDGKTYTFHFRKGVKFWDGTEMKADDVVFSYEHAVDKDVASYIAWMHDSVDSVKAVDDYTVEVKLKQADSTWLYAVATSGGGVFSKKYYESLKDPKTFGTSTGGIMGTGAYVFDEWKEGEKVTAHANKDYWDKDNMPKFDKVEFVEITDSTTRISAIGNNEIQASYWNQASQLDMMKSITAQNVDLQFNDAGTTQCLFLNITRKGLDDVNCRKALAYVFDGKKYVEGVYGDSAEAGDSCFLPPALRSYNDEAWAAYEDKADDYDYNLEKAKELMAASKYPDGFDMEIIVSTAFPTDETAALMLQESAKEIGINVKVKKVTPSERSATLYTDERDYDATIIQWDADFPESLSDLLPMFYSENCTGGGCNYMQYKNKTVDDLMLKAKAATDNSEKGQLITEICLAINADCPMINLSYPKRISLVRKEIAGYTPTPTYWFEPFIRYLYYTK